MIPDIAALLPSVMITLAYLDLMRHAKDRRHRWAYGLIVAAYALPLLIDGAWVAAYAAPLLA